MRRAIRKENLLVLFLCVAANIISIYGFVLWCTRTDLSYELIMNRAYDVGWFGSLYLWAMLFACIKIINPQLSDKSIVLNTVMKRPIELFYLMGILFKLIQGSHFIIPAAQELFPDNSTMFVAGFLIDIYFLISCCVEIFFKKKVLHLWNIGMLILYSGVLVFYFATGKISGHISCELFAHIVWQLSFFSITLTSYRKEQTEEIEAEK